MNGWKLLLVTDDDVAPDLALADASSVLDHWPEDSRPSLQITAAQPVLDETQPLDGIGAAWIRVAHTRTSALYELVGMLQERQIPTMVSAVGNDEPAGEAHAEGVVACPISHPPADACSILRTLWSQTPVIRALSAEVKLLTAHRGNLCDQIDKMDEELRMAAQLQREFLPTRLPEVADVGFHALWRPASYVSGDIYDVIRLDETHVGFFVADAVGHGVPAALMTVYIKRSLHTKQIDPSSPRGYRIISPGEALARLNRDILATQTGKVRFATACYGVIDTSTHEVVFARAGHPFPMILRGDGSTEMLEPEGGLLGVFEDEPFDETTVTLGPGDRLIVYSDGFEMAFPGEEQPTEAGKPRIANERYAEEFLDLGKGPASEAIERLESKLDLQAGSLNQRDDLTVLCVAVADEAENAGEVSPGSSITAKAG